MSAEVDRIFGYHPPTTADVIRGHEQVRGVMMATARFLLDVVPPCSERDRCIEMLDLAAMHANAAIAREQIAFPRQVQSDG